MSDPLDRLIALDTCREILACLEPLEVLIAVLRCHNLPDDKITTLLHLDPDATTYMARAKKRIYRRVPEAKPFLCGRRRRNPRRSAPPRKPEHSPSLCTGRTSMGHPCQSWAMPGTNPPRCYWHRAD